MRARAPLLLKVKESPHWDSLRRGWHRFTRSKLSVVGLLISVSTVLVAVLADYVAPYPEHAGFYINFEEALQPPSLEHPFGTDEYGRDVFSRTLFGFRFSLKLAGVVLSIVVPVGVLLGLVAGYYRGRIIDMIVMRVADMFISVPPLVLALAITSLLGPSLVNAMIAVTLMWWPWYARLTYNVVSSVRNEAYVIAAELIGAGPLRVMFREILPSILGPILTKATLDVGWVILIGAALSFVGLGAQPPTPDLGTMVADGVKYMPDYWWISIFPALAISYIILGFNLLGDGIRDVFAE